MKLDNKIRQSIVDLTMDATGTKAYDEAVEAAKARVEFLQWQTTPRVIQDLRYKPELLAYVRVSSYLVAELCGNKHCEYIRAYAPSNAGFDYKDDTLFKELVADLQAEHAKLEELRRLVTANVAAFSSTEKLVAAYPQFASVCEEVERLYAPSVSKGALVSTEFVDKLKAAGFPPVQEPIHEPVTAFEIADAMANGEL